MCIRDRSETCRLYPRFYADFGSLREAGLSLSCPEAARLILSNPAPMRFVMAQNDESSGYDPDLCLLYTSEHALGNADRCVYDLRHGPDQAAAYFGKQVLPLA